MIKKIFSIILSILCITICLCGCDKESSSNVTETDEKEETRFSFFDSTGKEVEYKEKFNNEEFTGKVEIKGTYTESAIKKDRPFVMTVDSGYAYEGYHSAIEGLSDTVPQQANVIISKSDRYQWKNFNYYSGDIKVTNATALDMIVFGIERLNCYNFYYKEDYSHSYRYNISYINDNKILKQSPEIVAGCNCIRYRVEDVETAKQVDICVCEELGIIMKVYDTFFTYFEITNLNIEESR